MHNKDVLALCMHTEDEQIHRVNTSEILLGSSQDQSILRKREWRRRLQQGHLLWKPETKTAAMMQVKPVSA